MSDTETSLSKFVIEFWEKREQSISKRKEQGSNNLYPHYEQWPAISNDANDSYDVYLLHDYFTNLNNCNLKFTDQQLKKGIEKTVWFE